jgi:uncharacterized membrane protein YgcG
VLPADDRRPGAQAELLAIMTKQAVEISRATAPFTVSVPSHAGARRPPRASPSDSAPSAESRVPSPAESRTFPAGSYIIRMDQPYSRIADALLDYQYWSPNDPQKNPYDDTGWTFPEGFNVQAVRVTDVKVLDAPMERVTGDIRNSGGVTGTGAVFAINNNADNALTTLSYRLSKADFQAAEESFEAAGKRFGRGSYIVKGITQADLDKAARELGVPVVALTAAPNVKMHPVRAARVAIMHTWLGTQTEGWWRQAFDQLSIPFTYISTQDAAKDPNLNLKYDVILFPPSGGNGAAIIQGMPMWRNPMPWKNSPETPNISTLAQTDDIRPGLGWVGLQNLESFVAKGGVLVGVTNTAEFAVQFGLTNGVSVNNAKNGSVVGTLLRSKLVDETSPIVYGVSDNLAVYSDDGGSFSVSSSRGGRGGGGFGGGGGGGGRPTGRGTADDPDVTQGRPLDPKFDLPPRPNVSPWQAAPVTDDQLRNPVNIIPPDQRPRVAMRFSDQRDLLVSGLLDGGGDIAQRAMVVDVPMQKGHVVLFANNPVYRGETIGSYALVFNTMLNWDNLNAGRKLDEK